MSDEAKSRVSRRGFLRRATALAAGAVAAPQFAVGATAKPRPVRDRLRRAADIRAAAAELAGKLGIPKHATNGDERTLDAVWARFSKGLPHDARGTADRGAADALWRAVGTEDPHAFEQVPLGGYLKLANPQAAFAFDLLGPDSHQVRIAPPPAFSSPEQASEVVELYWHALLRDVPFSDYDRNSLVRAACDELSSTLRFTGPREQARVTPATLFRGGTPGGLRGPYISQFLLRDLPWTPIRVPQRIRVAKAGDDHLTDEESWLRTQNGSVAPVNAYDDTLRYIRTGRDLAEYVHRDFTYQAFLGATLMLFRMSAPVDGGVPYHHSVTQSGFVTFGPSDILHLVAIVANIALKGTWYQKWVVHQRLRPEEYAARLHSHVRGDASYPFHLDALNSEAVAQTARRFGTRLLPQAYPEGAPLHPAYPSGHAAIAGACTTALKACFAESFVIPDPVVPAADGLSLTRYNGPELTVAGELDKLAENIALGRNFAGIHWRSDGVEGLQFGEAVAIQVLREMKLTSNETFHGYSLTTFAGKRITI